MFRGLDVGDVLSTSASVIGRNFVSLTIIVILCLSPAMALQLGFLFIPDDSTEKIATGLADGRPETIAPIVGIGLIIGLLQFIFSYVSQGAVMYLTVEQLAGRPASLGDSVRHAFSRVLWIILTALVEGILVALGFLLCIVPGVILACMFYVAVPVTIVERIGPLRSMNRSGELTAGYRWRVLLLLIIVAALGMALTFATGLVGGLFETAIPGLVGKLISFPITWAGTVLQTIVAATIVAVSYARLRSIREGIDAVALAQVFA